MLFFSKEQLQHIGSSLELVCLQYSEWNPVTFVIIGSERRSGMLPTNWLGLETLIFPASKSYRNCKKDFKNVLERVGWSNGSVVKWFSSVSVLLEDLGSTPSTYMADHNCL